MIIAKNQKIFKNHYKVKLYPNFGLKVIKITSKSDLDKNSFLIFPPITKNHYYIRTPSRTWDQNSGSYSTPRTPARDALVQKYPLEQWFSFYGQFTHFGQNLVFTAIFCGHDLIIICTLVLFPYSSQLFTHLPATLVEQNYNKFHYWVMTNPNYFDMVDENQSRPQEYLWHQDQMTAPPSDGHYHAHSFFGLSLSV